MNSFMRIFLFTILLLSPSTPAFPVPAGEAGNGDSHEHGSTVWTCSMHPQIQLPEFGQCPICFMDLIKVVVNNDRQGGLRRISLDSEARQLARVEVTPVIRKSIPVDIRMVGKVDYDETRMGSITARVDGRIDKLFIAYTGSAVRQGQAMANIYSPELLTAQAELIQAAQAARRLGKSESQFLKTTMERNEKAAREKLRLLGLEEKQIKEVIRRGEPVDHIIMTAPMSGIVIKKEVTEGRYVKTGTPIYTIADLSRLWVILEAYESDLNGLGRGQQVEFTVEAFPGTIFQGKVDYIDPLVDNNTRTVRVRLNVDNRRGSLKPGMLIRARARIGGEDTGEKPLLIPSSAPLITGKRALVYVQAPDNDGVYEGREVILGQRRGDYYQVRSGLTEGELVVTRGNFKIDSAIQIQARPSMMNPYRSEKTSTPVDLQPLFLSRLQLLNQTFNQYEQAMTNGNTAQYLAVLDNLNDSLPKLDPEAIDKEADRAAWKELSMLLQGDIILLREADSDQEVKLLHTAMIEHFNRIRTWGDLENETARHPGAVTLSRHLPTFYRAYIDLQDVLFADDPSSLSRSVLSLKNKAVPIWHKLKSIEHPEAINLSDKLKKSVEQFNENMSLEEIRTINFPLSTTLARIVSLFGTEEIGPVFEQYCPMAFNNTGAIWLAAAEDINNPYFGAVMPHCGEVRRQLAE